MLLLNGFCAIFRLQSSTKNEWSQDNGGISEQYSWCCDNRQIDLTFFLLHSYTYWVPSVHNFSVWLRHPLKTSVCSDLLLTGRRRPEDSSWLLLFCLRVCCGFTVRKVEQQQLWRQSSHLLMAVVGLIPRDAPQYDTWAFVSNKKVQH